MRRALVLLVAALVVLAGCQSVVRTIEGAADPEQDRLGWENGYWYDESISVTPGDGYNESEREKLVSRTMARVEKLRGLEFESTVPVEVISRQEYLQRRGGGNGSAGDRAHNLWNNQVWEAIFIVGEQADTAETFNSTLGATVQGFYSPGKDEIVVVSDSETPTIDRQTLAHELVHALQDQQFGLGGSPETQDRQLASNGVIEGDANYVESLYAEKCRGAWQCVPLPESGSGGGGGGSFNRGLFLTIFQPYATGPTFVDAIRERGGWSAVNALYDDKPVSTEQVIHPAKYPDEQPVDVTVRDRSNANWRRFDVDPVADTVGEASIYAMFVTNDAVGVSGQAVYRYESEPSAGWGGDAVVPYRNGRGEYGYVWKTVWDTEADAREFLAAYRTVLRNHDARNPTGNVWVVPEDDPYADAFRVVRRGKTVRVVNAPTRGQLDGVHGSG